MTTFAIQEDLCQAYSVAAHSIHLLWNPGGSHLEGKSVS